MPNRKKIRARARMYFFFTVMREEAFDNEELTHFPGLKLPLPSPVRGLAKNSCRGYIDSSAEAYRYRCGAWSSKPVDGREAVGRFDSYTPPPVYLKNKVKLRGASGALNFRRAQSCSPLRLQQQSAKKDQQSAGLEKAFRVEVSCRPPPPQSVLHISASQSCVRIAGFTPPSERLHLAPLDSVEHFMDEMLQLEDFTPQSRDACK